LITGKKAKAIKRKTVGSISSLDFVAQDGVTFSPKATGHVQGADGSITTYILNSEGQNASSDAVIHLEFDTTKKDSKEPKVSN
jgi:hypothetical protein